MDELQDAIEDAQYVNAMHDDIPKPTKEWKVLELFDQIVHLSEIFITLHNFFYFPRNIAS